MQYWQTVVEKPTGNPAMDDVAVVMDRVPKIVFSQTMKDLEWASAQRATRPLPEEVAALKHQVGKTSWWAVGVC